LAAKLTDKERSEIVAHLEAGKSQNWIAKEVGRSKDTVGRVGREAGIESDGRRTQKATEAAAAIRQIDRMEVISLGLTVGQKLLRKIEGLSSRDDVALETIRAYKDAMTGVAIGIDKHRLETGEATSRSETVDPERRKKMQESLDDLAAQRRKRLAG
jgi:IS30 family transposase